MKIDIEGYNVKRKLKNKKICQDMKRQRLLFITLSHKITQLVDGCGRGYVLTSWLISFFDIIHFSFR